MLLWMSDVLIKLVLYARGVNVIIFLITFRNLDLLKKFVSDFVIHPRQDDFYFRFSAI